MRSYITVQTEKRDSASRTRRPRSVCRYTASTGGSVSQDPLSDLVTSPRAPTSLNAAASPHRLVRTCERKSANVMGPWVSASGSSTTWAWFTNSRRLGTESGSPGADIRRKINGEAAALKTA